MSGAFWQLTQPCNKSHGCKYGSLFLFLLSEREKKKLQKLAKTNQALNDHNVPNIKMWAYWLFNQINVNAVLYNSIETLLLMENKGQSTHEVFSHIPS